MAEKLTGSERFNGEQIDSLMNTISAIAVAETAAEVVFDLEGRLREDAGVSQTAEHLDGIDMRKLGIAARWDHDQKAS